MKYYDIRHDMERFALIEVRDRSAVPYFDGQVIGSSWPSLHGRLVEGEPGDFAYFGPGALACRRSTWLKLSTKISAEVESLPVEMQSQTEPYHVLNVTNVRSCLDENNSVIQYIPGTRTVMRVKAYRILEKKVGESFLFKMPQLVRSGVYCTERFRTLVESGGMTGLTFAELRPAALRLVD